MVQLTRDEIWEITEKHFGDLGWDTVNNFQATIVAESSGKTHLTNDNYPRWQTVNSPYRYDYGLCMINSIHGYDSKRLLNDPDYNMWAARQIFDREGINAWFGYRWGYYKQYLRQQMPARLLPKELQAVFITEFYGGPQPKHPDVLMSDIQALKVDGQWDEYMIRIKRPKDYEGRV